MATENVKRISWIKANIKRRIPTKRDAGFFIINPPNNIMNQSFVSRLFTLSYITDSKQNETILSSEYLHNSLYLVN